MTILNGKGFSRALSTILALLAPGAAFADIDTIRGEDNSLWLAAGAAHIDYAEFADNGANLDTELGTLPALSGGFTYLDPYNNIYLAMDADGAWGNLRYNGGLRN